MEIAERQQAAVQAALDGLAAERAALARKRESLAREVASLGQRTRQAVQSAVAESLAGAAVEGVAAMRVATRPLVDNLEGVAAGAVRAEEALPGGVMGELALAGLDHGADRCAGAGGVADGQRPGVVGYRHRREFAG